MSRLYIHIGAKKTGSTSLQYFLKQNSAFMRTKGIFVATTLGQTEDKFLSRLYMGSASVDAVRRKEIFFRQCRAFFLQGGAAAIVTAESLSDLSVEEIRNLKKDLDPHFDDFRIIFYIRRQDLVAVSHYSTMLRGGGTSRRLMSVGLGKRGRRALSYGSILKDWVAVFEARNIVVRKYVEKWEGDWDVVADFLTQIGLDGPAGCRVSNRNVPLSGEAAACLRKYNQLAKQGVIRPSHHARQHLISILQTLESKIKIPKPSIRAARKFFKSFHEENEMVRRMCFPEKEPLFKDNFSMYPAEATDIDSILSVEYSIRVMDLLLASSQRELDNESEAG
jgi:hypothetical protein